METVEDDEGRRYVRLKESQTASLVHDPKEDTSRFIPNDELSVVTDDDPLTVSAKSIPDPLRTLIVGVPTEQSLGLLVLLQTRDGMTVREMLDGTSYCERDLYATLRSLQATTMIEPDSQREDTARYVITDEARKALAWIDQC